MSDKNLYKNSKWTVIRRDGYIADPVDPVVEPKVDPKPADPKGTPPAATPDPANWDEFLAAQPEPVKKLYTDHHTKLLNAVKATRGDSKALEDRINELLPKAEKGSELEKSLQELTEKLKQETRRSSFLESAIKPEIGCRNPENALIIASKKDLFKKDGTPDWEEIKKAYPEGFTQPGDPPKPAPTVSPTVPNTTTTLTKEVIEKMTPEEINKHWKDGTLAEFLKNNQK
jgi:hypothetical protein